MPKTSNKSSSDQPFVVSHPALALSLVAVILVCIFSSLWWTKVHDSPRRVFMGMIKNNLSTPSVTRQTVAGQDSSVDKLEQLSFVPPYATRSLISITQDSPEGSNKVVTETVGTLSTDYSRYISIETSQKGKSGKSLDYSSVQNLWGATDPTVGPADYHSQSILGLVPFGNINSIAQQEIISKLIDGKAYTVDYSAVKPFRTAGKSALVFPVQIDAEKYIQVLKDLSKVSGNGDLSDLNPKDYAGQQPITVSIMVDKKSRHILEVSYGQQKEVYSSYGLSTPVQTPNKTIPVNELQQKIQEIK